MGEMGEDDDGGNQPDGSANPWNEDEDALLQRLVQHEDYNGGKGTKWKKIAGKS